MMSKNGIVISVGAGFPQTPFIKKLKDEGYEVAGFGMGRNDPEAIALCDYFEEISTADAHSSIQWIESLNKKVIGAGSFAGGVAIDTLQKIERHFDLPTQTPEFLSVGMDKHKQQKLYNKLGLSNIATFHISELKERSELLVDENKYILKPVIGRGSSGVYKLTGLELKDWLINKELGDEDLVQEFLVGDEYRLMAIIQNSKLRLLAQVKRDSLQDTFLLGRLTIMDSHKESLIKYMDHLISETKIVNAIIKFDVIINDDVINMIEMDIGVGGGLYYKKFIEEAYGLNIVEEYINLITNKPLSFENPNSKPNIRMDYIYNYKCKPIKYNKELIEKHLIQKVGEFKLVKNLLSPELSGRFETNADFIFTIIHQSDKFTTIELNQEINNFFTDL